MGEGLLRKLPDPATSRFRLRDAADSDDDADALSLQLEAVNTGTLWKTDMSVLDRKRAKREREDDLGVCYCRASAAVVECRGG